MLKTKDLELKSTTFELITKPFKLVSKKGGKMKKNGLLFLVILSFVFVGAQVSANTVSIHLDGVRAVGTEIGGFQLFFHAPDGTFEYPLDYDFDTFSGDFNYEWGAGQPPAGGWILNGYPIDSVGNKDFATGYAAVSANDTNPVLILNDGLVVTLSSVDSFFGINLNDPSNKFFDFASSAELTNLKITEEWFDTSQVVTIAPIPIPGSILLLGSGLVGLIGIARRKRS